MISKWISNERFRKSKLMNGFCFKSKLFASNKSRKTDNNRNRTHLIFTLNNLCCLWVFVGLLKPFAWLWLLVVICCFEVYIQWRCRNELATFQDSFWFCFSSAIWMLHLLHSIVWIFGVLIWRNRFIDGFSSTYFFIVGLFSFHNFVCFMWSADDLIYPTCKCSAETVPFSSYHPNHSTF